MNFKKFGKYTIIKKIASGGMADILLATELSPTGFGRFVVIKRALSKFSDNEEFKDMFKNEGKVACNLKHKNITTIHEFGIERNQFFLAMEYLSGKNLREFTKKLQARNIQLNIPNIIYIIKEIAAGLNYAHNAIDANTGKPLNIIHRDVSPQNVMMTFDGQIKLIDFGIAKIADTNLTRAGHLKGKFSYMSPEQANGHDLDGRADIFCLGIIFWELLTSKRLFASSNELVSLKKVRNCDIPDAKKINPDISSKLNSILNKSLSKNPSSRYITAAKLEQDLNLFLNTNYPEYSHYDFITLMKQTYRKDIMSERESLKTYSIEFKKYTNSLNIEKTFKTPIILDIPDITSLNTNNKNQTQSVFTESFQDRKKPTKTSPFSNPANFFESTQENTSKTEKAQLDKSTTLILDNTTQNISLQKDLQTENNKPSNPVEQTQQTKLMTEVSLNAPKTNPKLKLEQKKPKQTDLSKMTTTLLSQNKDWDDEDTTSMFKFKKAAGLIFALLIIGGFSLGGFWILTNQSKTTATAPTSPPIIPTQPNKYNTQRQPTSSPKKIFIRSNPSNAGIYINNKFTQKYTPAPIHLNLSSNVIITIKRTGFHSKEIQINQKNFQNSIFIKLVKTEETKRKPTHFIQKSPK